MFKKININSKENNVRKIYKDAWFKRATPELLEDKTKDSFHDSNKNLYLISSNNSSVSNSSGILAFPLGY